MSTRGQKRWPSNQSLTGGVGVKDVTLVIGNTGGLSLALVTTQASFTKSQKETGNKWKVSKYSPCS